VTFILGASGDIVSGDAPDFEDKSQFNPKVGVLWNPFPSTTVRAAAFRVLKRTLITNQTLEPTQVAGFNQFFDDLNGTEAWRYGGAIDQKFTNDLFGGLELSQRDLNVPFFDFADPENPVVREEDWRERLGRAYLFWTPHAWVALRLEYMIERFTSDGMLLQPRELDTHRVQVGIGFFHPSGFSASLRATYFNQDGTFVLQDGSVRDGRDDFWTVDAGISYRLPKRYGFITVGATNLFDTNFKYFDRDLNNASIQPTRTIFARLTLALP
jgi:outer membrane receptor protein involved in Fe transport